MVINRWDSSFFTGRGTVRGSEGRTLGSCRWVTAEHCVGEGVGWDAGAHQVRKGGRDVRGRAGERAMLGPIRCGVRSRQGQEAWAA